MPATTSTTVAIDLLGTDTDAEVETRLADLKNAGGVLAASGS